MEIRTTKKSRNITPGRSGWKPDIIVCHISEGYYETGCDWLCNPASGASTHFFVSKQGQVSQLVDIKDTAWGNGTTTKAGDSRYYGNSTIQAVKDRKTNANNFTISVEHEGFYKDSKGSLTNEQLEATVELIRHIIREVKRLYDVDIAIDRQHIVGHCDIAPRWKLNCPGQNFPFDEILKRLNVTISKDLTSTFNNDEVETKNASDIYETTLTGMVSKGVISSPDYWRNLKVPYLNELLTNANKEGLLDSRIDNGIDDINIALETLQDAGIVSSPEYWLNLANSGQVKYIKELLINMANRSKIILQKIVHAEARGEGEKGQILVANVINNRCRAKQYPNGIYNVVFQKNQFEPTRNGAYKKAVPSESVIIAVDKALNEDYSNGALFFRTTKGGSGSWHERNLSYVFTHGGHAFFK